MEKFFPSSESPKFFSPETRREEFKIMEIGMNGRDKFTIMSLFTGDVYYKHLSRLDPRRALRPLFFPLETIFHRSTAASKS